MASTYPQTVDVFSTKIDDASGTSVDPNAKDSAAHINDLQNAIVALENESRTGTVFNVKHYGAIGDGVTDDSVAINAAATAANVWALTNKAAIVLFPSATYMAANIVVYANCTYELNNSSIKLRPGGAVTDDVFRTNLFQTVTTTGAGLGTNPTMPHSFIIRNGIIDGNAPNVGIYGRHCLAIFGFAYTLENLVIIQPATGSCVWSEYGNNSEEYFSGNYEVGDEGFFVKRCAMMDGTLYAPGIVTAPTGNDLICVVTGVTSTVNPTITVSRPHFMSVGSKVVISGVLGSTTVNGSWNILATPTPNTFTITLAAPAAWVSGGTQRVNGKVSACWTILGPHDSQADGVIVVAAGGMYPGRRGVLCGVNGFGASTGMGFTNFHPQNNFEVTLDSVSGHTLVGDTCQLEGAYKCIVLLRVNGNNTVHGDIYAGQGSTGVTALSIRDNNENDIRTKMWGLGGGVGTATAMECQNTKNNLIEVNVSHGSATNLTLGAGTIPDQPQHTSFFVNSYGAGTTTPGWVPPMYVNGAVLAGYWALEQGNALRIEAGATVYSGTGVPNNAMGANGDEYHRVDGATGAWIYQRRAGVWVASAA